MSVLSGARYGYGYIRKTDEAPAAYVVDEAEARVVRRIYEMYTVEGLSIGEITRRLNNQVLEQGILVPPDTSLLLHVTSAGFREWKESTGKGKPVHLASGDRLKLDVQLNLQSEQFSDIAQRTV